MIADFLKGQQNIVLYSKVNVALFFLLVCLAPVAMLQEPYNALDQFSEPAGNTRVLLRSILILVGFACSLASVLCCTFVLVHPDSKNYARKMFHLCVTLCILSIGWRSFPYWAHGVLLPHLDVSEAAIPTIQIVPILDYGLALLWLIGLPFVYGIILTLGPILLIATFCAISIKEWYYGICSMVVLAILGFSIYLTPDFLDWLID